jgi:Mor family transcriptional regulator
MLPVRPYTNKTVRDREIYERYRQGETVVVLAQAYDLSVSRIR